MSMLMKDTTVSEFYLQMLLLNDAMTPGNIWKNISINILIKFSWLAVRQTHDDELPGKNSIVIQILPHKEGFLRRKM